MIWAFGPPETFKKRIKNWPLHAHLHHATAQHNTGSDMSNWWRTSLSATQPTAHPRGGKVFRFKFYVLCITTLNAPRKRLTFPLVRRSNCSQCIVSRAKPSCDFSSGLFLKLSAQVYPGPQSFHEFQGVWSLSLLWKFQWKLSSPETVPGCTAPEATPPDSSDRPLPSEPRDDIRWHHPLSCPEAPVNHSDQK